MREAAGERLAPGDAAGAGAGDGTASALTVPAMTASHHAPLPRALPSALRTAQREGADEEGRKLTEREGVWLGQEAERDGACSGAGG